MNRSRRRGTLSIVVAAGASLSLLAATFPDHPARSVEPVIVRPELAVELASAPHGSHLVLVTGDTTARTVAAVSAAGLETVEVFDRIAVVAAAGPAHAVRTVHAQPGIRRVDANVALEPAHDLAHRATGIAALRDTETHPQLRRVRRRGHGTPYDGTGVSIAVIDSGFDTGHEQFTHDGVSKFDVHLRQACPTPRLRLYHAVGTDPTPDCSAWLPAVPEFDDSVHGHGTGVAAVAAGYPRTTPRGQAVSGVAPGARLVGLSVGAPLTVYNTTSALNWVLEHHDDPCGDGSCVPIRVVNNSYGLPADDDLGSREFDPDSPWARVTDALVDEDLVVVFAAGNDGGDGTATKTSWLALNPTPGVLSVGAYSHGNAGDRDAGVADLSSRGQEGDPTTYPDLVAPGEHYLTACEPVSFECRVNLPDGPYGWFNGTSLAAPYVAGVVALLLEAAPSLTPSDVEHVLEASAYPFQPDERPTFDAGHGLVDAVGALSRVVPGRALTAPASCDVSDTVMITDPPGDTTLHGLAPVPTHLPGHDIVSVSATLTGEPGALTVVVSYADLPRTQLLARTEVWIDLDRARAQVELNRSPAGDRFSVVDGQVEVSGSVDPDADTATFVIDPHDGGVRERASVYWAWTASGIGRAEHDLTSGTCPVLVP